MKKNESFIKNAGGIAGAGNAIWDALPEADRKDQLKEIGVLKLETSKKEWLELPPITRQRLEEKFKTKSTALEVGKRYKIQRPDGIKEYNLTNLQGNLAQLMDDAGKKFSAPIATLESGLNKGQVVEAYSNQVKEYCPDCKIPLRNIGKDGAIQLRDCPRCSKVSALAENPHKNEKKAGGDYPFHQDEDRDIVWEVPFMAKSIEELISIDDDDLQEFLYSELTHDDMVETQDGNVFVGDDIIGFLPKEVRISPMDEHKSSNRQAYISDESIQYFIGRAIHYLNQYTPTFTDFTDDDITYYVAQKLEERIGKPLSPDEYGHVEQMVKSAATKDEVIEEMQKKQDKFYKEDPKREKYLKKIIEKHPVEKKESSRKESADTHMRFCSACGKKSGVHSDKAWKDKLDMCQFCYKDYERNEKPKKKNEPIEEPEMDKVEANKKASEGYEDITCPHCGSDETVFHQYVDGGSWSCQACGEWTEDKDLSKKEAAGPDEHAARELQLYIENDRDIYDTQTEPIQKQLMKKIKKGIFDFERSIKAWEHLVDRAAQKYMYEFASPGDKVKDTFNNATRLQVARSLAEHFKAEADLGNLDYLLEKKQEQKPEEQPKEGSVKQAEIDPEVKSFVDDAVRKIIDIGSIAEIHFNRVYNSSADEDLLHFDFASGGYGFEIEKSLTGFKVVEVSITGEGPIHMDGSLAKLEGKIFPDAEAFVGTIQDAIIRGSGEYPDESVEGSTKQAEDTYKDEYIIRSDSEDGYWSNEDGWGGRETATIFNHFERFNMHPPISCGNDTQWMQIPSKKTSDKKQANNCFCGEPADESLQNEEHPLCPEHLKEIHDINDKIMDTWPKYE